MTEDCEEVPLLGVAEGTIAAAYIIMAEISDSGMQGSRGRLGARHQM